MTWAFGRPRARTAMLRMGILPGKDRLGMFRTTRPFIQASAH